MPVALCPGGGQPLLDDVASFRANPGRCRFAGQFVGLRPKGLGALVQGDEFVEAGTAGAAEHGTRSSLPAGLGGSRLVLEVPAAPTHTVGFPQALTSVRSASSESPTTR